MGLASRLVTRLGLSLALGLAVLNVPAAAAAGAGGGRVVYEGTVAVAVEDDFARGRATRRYFLEEQHLGQRFELKLSDPQGRQLRTGQRIRVRGVVQGGALSADVQSDGVTVLAEPMAAAPVAARKALVMLVDITDSTSTTSRVSAECDGATAKSADIMFGSQTGAANVDGCYQDSSFGALGFGGTTYPGSALDVIRVAVTEAAALGSVCNYTAWGSAADKAASAAGVTLANYQHRVYVVPANAGCGWAGLAYVGCGNSCQSWIKAYQGQACGYSDAYAHELGHNLGMWHASTDTNNDGTLDCEYCDTSDFMGYALPNLRTLSGPHKVQMGWASGARVVDGSAGGTFTVSALELKAAAFPQVVKVVPNGGDTYYLSLRSAIGYDAGIPSAATHLDKLAVHRWNGSGNTRFITTLGDGQAYNDAASGLTVRQLSHTADSATFEVGTTCAAQAPAVTIGPSSQGAGAELPATRTYSLTVTNRDSAACGTQTFALTSVLPAGWTGGVATAALALAPGASGTVNLEVTAPAGTSAGSFTVKGGTVASPGHDAVTASATFWVDTIAPLAPTGLRATVKANKVTLSWAAAADTGGSGIARYRVLRNSAQVGSPVSTTYTDAPGTGTFTYTVVAVDGAGNLSPVSSAVTVKVGRK
jgi:hypothetical protein